MLWLWLLVTALCGPMHLLQANRFRITGVIQYLCVSFLSILCPVSCPQAALVLCPVKLQGLLAPNAAVTSHGGPFLLPVAPGCFSWPLFIHYLWSGCLFQPPTYAGGSGALLHQSVCEFFSCRVVGERHSACVHHSTNVCSVGCICNRSLISEDTASGEVGLAPLLAVLEQ